MPDTAGMAKPGTRGAAIPLEWHPSATPGDGIPVNQQADNGNRETEVSDLKIGVIGAGVMGSGIAQSLATAGFETVGYERF